MMFCRIWSDQIVGPFLIEWNLTAMVYIDMLKNYFFMSILYESGDTTALFQQNDAPLIYDISVH